MKISQKIKNRRKRISRTAEDQTRLKVKQHLAWFSIFWVGLFYSGLQINLFKAVIATSITAKPNISAFCSLIFSELTLNIFRTACRG